MDFYNLNSNNNIKEIILNQYEKMIKQYSAQPQSDEYRTATAIHELVNNFDFEQVQNVLEADNTSFCWLNSYAGKVYINVKNKKGYRYNLKNSCLGAI